MNLITMKRNEDAVEVICNGDTTQNKPKMFFTLDEAHELAHKLADVLGYDLQKRDHEDKYTTL